FVSTRTDFFIPAVREWEEKMNVVEHVPASFPDKILGKQERNLTDPPVPFSEREYFKTDNYRACATWSAPIIHEVAPAIEANSDAHRLERIVTDPHVSTIPDDEASIPSSKPSKKHLCLVA